jgi:hypothetical protein
VKNRSLASILRNKPQPNCVCRLGRGAIYCARCASQDAPGGRNQLRPYARTHTTHRKELFLQHAPPRVHARDDINIKYARSKPTFKRPSEQLPKLFSNG